MCLGERITLKINRKYCDVPIYVGKAVPSGWRRNRVVDDTVGTALYSRLRQQVELQRRVIDCLRENFDPGLVHGVDVRGFDFRPYSFVGVVSGGAARAHRRLTAGGSR